MPGLEVDVSGHVSLCLGPPENKYSETHGELLTTR